MIDDWLPTRDGVQPAFASSITGSLFVPLVEKACAKLFGSYLALKTGSAHLGLRMMTGAPHDVIICVLG